MEDNNRINRRSRPRPYDLRRKVLLKNFLREQMTHIPISETGMESAQNNNGNFAEESSVSVDMDEDISKINENVSSLPTDPLIAQSSSPSLCDNINMDPNPIVTEPKEDVSNNIDSDNSSDVNLSCHSNSPTESSSFKFASLIRFKKDSKKKTKGVLKAKDVCKSMKSPMKTRSFKSGLERVFYGRKRPSESTSSNQVPRSSPRSLFNLFKQRREQRNIKETKMKKSPPVSVRTPHIPSKYNTINQSVQTDDSWAKEELARVQQSNKRLKEENRLLSESLSYFMSNASMDPQIRHCNSPLQSSNKNTNSTVFPDYYVSSSNSNSNSWNPRSRVTRSKSVQDYHERRNIARNNYRTRSMNYHNYRSNLFPTNNRPSVSSHSVSSQVINIPRVRRKNVLANLPVSGAVRGIQRRSSMPERILSENDRSVVCRRSGSFRDNYSRKPFHSLPSEAFY